VINQLFKEKLQFTCNNCHNDITDYLKNKTVNALNNEQILDILAKIPEIEICGTCELYFKDKIERPPQLFSFCRKYRKDVEIFDYCENFEKKRW
jgi:hypothetical protein